MFLFLRSHDDDRHTSVVLPQPFDNVINDVKDISSLLDLSPVTPSFGRILAWSYEGDEVELEGWSRDELIEKNSVDEFLEFRRN